MGGGAGGANGALGAEMCAPLLMLCWLCCWPDDNSDSSSEKLPKPKIFIEPASHRRSNELFGRRFGSSAVSLHLPSTSGHTKQPLSAHRSHEEIRSRRKSHHDTAEQEARYHSAPSVIDEVLHRRDWERSTKDLYIPLKPNDEPQPSGSNTSSDMSLDETSSVIENKNELTPRTCKKHYTNIKSSRKKEANTKEAINTDIKDQDATENISNFYIGDTSCQLSEGSKGNEYNNDENNDAKAIVKAKETKQCLNECIKSKDLPKKALVPLAEFQVCNGFDENIDDIFVDRSGAVHHSVESRSSLFGTHAIPFPPPSVEAVGYESDASYLEEASGPPSASWRRVSVPAGWARARHASVGDVLAPAPALRPQSAALSESDLDFELEGCDEPPPAYDEVQLLASIDRKETAI